MSDKHELHMLLESVRGYRMTDAERIDQAISFAYGNLRIEEPNVPRSAVEAAVRHLFTLR